MHIYMHIYICINTSTDMNACMHGLMHACKHTHIYYEHIGLTFGCRYRRRLRHEEHVAQLGVDMRVIYLSMDISSLSIYLSIYLSIHAYTYMRICMDRLFIYIYIYIYMYVYTHTQI